MDSFTGASKLGDVPPERIDLLPQIRYRQLKYSDRGDLVYLHQQCFPVHYESQFFDKAVDGRLWSCAAIVAGEGRQRSHSPMPTPQVSSNHDACAVPPSSSATVVAGRSPTRSDGSRSGEDLAAVIISQISPQGEFEDVVLRDRDPSHHVAYICTLGVFPAFRKHGLATTLLEVLVRHAESDPSIKALSLHVLTTNEVALRFYERNGFTRLKLLPAFYNIGGRPCDAYLYARHFNGGAAASSLLACVLAALRAPLDAICARLFCQMRGISLPRWSDGDDSDDEGRRSSGASLTSADGWGWPVARKLR